jgi:hypothetical protein
MVTICIYTDRFIKSHSSKVVSICKNNGTGNYNQKSLSLPDFQLKVIHTTATGKL